MSPTPSRSFRSCRSTTRSHARRTGNRHRSLGNRPEMASVGNYSGGAGNRTRVRKPSIGTSTCCSSWFRSPGLRPRAGSHRAIVPLSRPLLGPLRRGPARSVTPSGELWQAHPLDGSRLVFRQRELVRYRSQLWFPTGIYEVGWPLEHAVQISWPPSKPIAPFRGDL